MPHTPCRGFPERDGHNQPVQFLSDRLGRRVTEHRFSRRIPNQDAAILAIHHHKGIATLLSENAEAFLALP
jgi:hypothetical protein